jgi:hypothetical protein
MRLRRTALVAAAATAAACAGAPAAPPAGVGPGPVEPTAACVVPGDAAPAAPPGVAVLVPLRIVVPDVDRFVAAQAYETLVRVDCTGAVVPAAAVAWTSDDHGRTWTFTLRDDLRLHDGSPVTGQMLVRAWAGRSVRGPAAVAVGGAASRVRVESSAPVTDPRHFAQPALAIAVPHDDAGPGGAPPLGTGPYRVEAHAGVAARLILHEPPTGVGAPASIAVAAITGPDPRTALDGDADAVLTRDPRLLAYAEQRPEWSATPLGWSRTHVLAGRGAASDAGRAVPAGALPVPSNGRPAQPPPTGTDPSCVRPTTVAPGRPDPTATAPSTILYDADDPVARALAERITALAWPAGRASWLAERLGRTPDTPPVARAVSRARLERALGDGDALAIILDVPRTPIGDERCVPAYVTQLVEAALATGWSLTPLIDTRDILLHRASVGRVEIDGDGMPRFGRAR